MENNTNNKVMGGNIIGQVSGLNQCCKPKEAT